MMTTDLKRYQRDIVNAAVEFAKGEFDNEHAIELDRNAHFPKAIWEKAADLGFIGIHFDETYGGGGMDLFEQVLIAESFCRADSTIGAALMLSGFAAECLHNSGAESLKRKYLPEVAEGNHLFGGALVPGLLAGGGVALPVTASRYGQQWCLNGEVSDVVNGDCAHAVIIAATVDENESRNGEPALFILTRVQDGVSVHPSEETLGLRSTSFSKLEFNNVLVTNECLLAIGTKSRKILKCFWDEGRIILAAMAVGMAQGAFERARDYVKERRQFGNKLAVFQVTRHKLAQMSTKIETARQITYRAAKRKSSKNRSPSLGTMAKLYAARAAVEVAYEAIQLLGGYGYMTEYQVERCYRDAKALELFGGNTSCLLDEIGDAVIGKIR